jgi:hypothetical protein
VFDLTDQKSFKSVLGYLHHPTASVNVVMLLVGTKSDLTSERVVSFETAKDFADNLGIEYIETSAKDGTNVEQVFMTLTRRIKNSMAERRGLPPLDPFQGSTVALPPLPPPGQQWHELKTSKDTLSRLMYSDITLNSLDLSGSTLGENDVLALAAALRSNTALTFLDVGSARASNVGVTALLEALKVNSTLKTLNTAGVDSRIEKTFQDALGMLQLTALHTKWASACAAGTASEEPRRPPLHDRRSWLETELFALSLPQLHTLDLSHNTPMWAKHPHIIEGALLKLRDRPLVTTLHLAHCGLSELPAAVLELPRLTSLDVSHNALRVLPATLPLRLGALKELRLEGNPLHTPPVDVVSAGTAAVLAFCRDMAEGGEAPWPVMKMLLLGEQRAGKTSLLNSMRRGRVDLAKVKERTVGIDIWSWRPFGAFCVGDHVRVQSTTGEGDAAVVAEVKAVNGDDTYDVAVGLQTSIFSHRPRQTIEHSALELLRPAPGSPPRLCADCELMRDGGHGGGGMGDDTHLTCVCLALLVRAYDVGGHDEYKSTHHFYLSHDAVFLLVADASLLEWDESFGAAFERQIWEWHELVCSRVGGNPSFLVVGTHADCCRDGSTWQARVTAELCKRGAAAVEVLLVSAEDKATHAAVCSRVMHMALRGELRDAVSGDVPSSYAAVDAMVASRVRRGEMKPIVSCKDFEACAAPWLAAASTAKLSAKVEQLEQSKAAAGEQQLRHHAQATLLRGRLLWRRFEALRCRAEEEMRHAAAAASGGGAAARHPLSTELLRQAAQAKEAAVREAPLCNDDGTSTPTAFSKQMHSLPKDVEELEALHAAEVARVAAILELHVAGGDEATLTARTGASPRPRQTAVAEGGTLPSGEIQRALQFLHNRATLVWFGADSSPRDGSDGASSELGRFVFTQPSWLVDAMSMLIRHNLGSSFHFTKFEEALHCTNAACPGGGAPFEMVMMHYPSRHHCRACGRTFCDACSPSKAALPEAGEAAVRVCSACSLGLQCVHEMGHPATPAEVASAVKKLRRRGVLERWLLPRLWQSLRLGDAADKLAALTGAIVACKVMHPIRRSSDAVSDDGADAGAAEEELSTFLVPQLLPRTTEQGSPFFWRKTAALWPATKPAGMLQVGVRYSFEQRGVPNGLMAAALLCCREYANEHDCPARDVAIARDGACVRRTLDNLGSGLDPVVIRVAHAGGDLSIECRCADGALAATDAGVLWKEVFQPLALALERAIRSWEGLRAQGEALFLRCPGCGGCDGPLDKDDDADAGCFGEVPKLRWHKLRERSVRCPNGHLITAEHLAAVCGPGQRRPAAEAAWAAGGGGAAAAGSAAASAGAGALFTRPVPHPAAPTSTAKDAAGAVLAAGAAAGVTLLHGWPIVGKIVECASKLKGVYDAQQHAHAKCGAMSAWADKVCRTVRGLPLESAAAAAGVEECLVGISDELTTMLTAVKKYQAEGTIIQYVTSSQCDSALEKGEVAVGRLLQLLGVGMQGEMLKKLDDLPAQFAAAAAAAVAAVAAAAAEEETPVASAGADESDEKKVQNINDN